MHKHHVLVVDDESTNLHIMRQILKDDYRLSFTKSGGDAIRHVEDTAPDIILLDVMLPDMDGFEVCRRLKANPATASIPIIFITSKDASSDEALAFQAGAADYITKPVSRAVVLARVNNQLSVIDHSKLKKAQLYLLQRITTLTELESFPNDDFTAQVALFADLLVSKTGSVDANSYKSCEEVAKAYVILMLYASEDASWNSDDAMAILREGARLYYDSQLLDNLESVLNEQHAKQNTH